MDKETSNWLRYVNCPLSEGEANLISFQFHQNIYYRTFKPIKKFVHFFNYDFYSIFYDIIAKEKNN